MSPRAGGQQDASGTTAPQQRGPWVVVAQEAAGERLREALSSAVRGQPTGLAVGRAVREAAIPDRAQRAASTREAQPAAAKATCDVSRPDCPHLLALEESRRASEEW